MKAYEAGFNSESNGLETENALHNLFKKAEGTQKSELMVKLERFLERYHKQPNALAQIHLR